MSARWWAVIACMEFALYVFGMGDESPNADVFLWFTFACSAMALTAKETR